MSSIIRSKKKCVICGHEHVFGEVLGTNATGYMDLDTRPPMMKRATLPYEIQMCDKCFYSNSDIETRIPGLNTETLKSKEYLRVANNKEINSTAKAFWLAALLQISVADYREAGILFLNAAWIFDDLGEKESAKLARLESHKYLSIFVEETEDINLAVLTVDLQRRMGGFSDAIDTANQLISYGVEIQSSADKSKMYSEYASAEKGYRDAYEKGDMKTAKEYQEKMDKAMSEAKEQEIKAEQSRAASETISKTEGSEKTRN